METLKNTSGGTSNASAADGKVEGLLTTSAHPNNPQVTIPEGSSPATVAALPLPAPPPMPSFVSAGIPRASAKTRFTHTLLRGPVPQKGSGQDRFREMLKQTEEPCLTTMAQSNPFAVPVGAIQRPMMAQSYSSSLTSVDTPPFTFHRPTFTQPDNQGMNRVVPTPSDVKVEMPLAFKRERKGSSLAEPKPIPGEARGELRRQNTIVGSGVQSHILATARLSAQCQLRHFNPKWHETSGPGGFKCSVQLLNKMIHGEHAYSTAYDAKQAAAEKALVYVRRLPCKDPAEKIAVRIRSAEQTDRYCDRNRQGRAQGKKEPTESTSHTSFHGQHTYAAPPGDNAATYTWNTYNYNEQRAFLHRIQSLFGGSGPSPAVLSDPLAAQAFLQGLAVGTSVRAAGLAYDPYLEPQGRPVPTISGEIYRRYDVREQSPARDFSRNYRGRSPPPRRMP